MGSLSEEVKAFGEAEKERNAIMADLPDYRRQPAVVRARTSERTGGKRNSTDTAAETLSKLPTVQKK